jgi:hypothetical protein
MVFDPVKFEKFCLEHPQLVRRLRQKLRCEKPKNVVDFLKENQRIPTLFVDNPEEAGPKWRQGLAPLKPPADRFPVLPPPPPQTDPQELNCDSIDRFTDDFDAFTAARAWFRYAQKPLPPMDPDLPGLPQAITDPVNQRLPPFTVAIFRLQPALVQNFIADRLEQEGWFDTEGWLITDWFPGNRFPSSGKETRVGAGHHWAAEAWSKAFETWQQLGQETHLYLNPREESRMKELAQRYYEKLGLPKGGMVPYRSDLKPDDPDYEWYRAARFMYLYFYYRSMTNFSNHYHRSEVEAKPEVVQARRAFYEADQLRLQARRDQALRRYESPDALEAWRQILDKYPEFRQESTLQEDSYETQLKYLALVKDLRGRLFKHLLGVEDCLVQGTMPPGPAGSLPALIHLALANNWPIPEVQPEPKRRLDSPGSDGQPLVGPEAVEVVLIRRGLKKPPPMANAPEMMGGTQPQGILPVPLAAPK